MFAIVSSGGKQFKVEKDSTIDVERIPGELGSKVLFGEVLAAGKGAEMSFGSPFLANMKVEGEIVKHLRGPKLISFKMKRRKGYKKTIGHRQEITRVRITSLENN